MPVIRIMGFQGEVPRVHPRPLPDNASQRARNVKLERGILQPYRRPQPEATLIENAKTIYRSGPAWLHWNAEVEVAPGPVAEERLYITGDGVPKVRVGTTTYPLAVPTPAARPVAALRTSIEFLSVGGVEVALQNGRTATTAGGWSISVAVIGDRATVALTHPTGFSPANMQNLVDGLRFRHGLSRTVPSLKVVRITRIQDNGGVIIDKNRNPKGSDTRYYSQLGSIVRVGGIDLNYTFDPEVQDTSDTPGQNDAPTIAATGLNPNYAQNGDPSVGLFSGTVVSTTDNPRIWVYNNPLTTKEGNRVIEIKAPNHGLVAGRSITITGAVATGGQNQATLNGTHEVWRLPDENTIWIRVPNNSTSTVTGGGPDIVITSE